jgi:hypothetical protein
MYEEIRGPGRYKLAGARGTGKGRGETISQSSQREEHKGHKEEGGDGQGESVETPVPVDG